MGRYEFFGRCLDRCESPIEILFLKEVVFSTKPRFEPLEGVDGVIASDDQGVLLYQQARVLDRYRLDFMLVHQTRRVAVELDGYAFHSSQRSFEQDRVRDRDLLAAGFATARFTGAEVQRNAYACLLQAYALARPVEKPTSGGSQEARRINDLPWDEQVKALEEAQSAAEQRAKGRGQS